METHHLPSRNLGLRADQQALLGQLLVEVGGVEAPALATLALLRGWAGSHSAPRRLDVQLWPGQSSLSAGALRYRAWAQSWSSAALADFPGAPREAP